MNFYSILTTKAPQSDRLMSMFAIIMAINYPAYLIFWRYNTPWEYLGIGLRAVATVLCLLLLFRKHWPSQIKKWLPIYWYGMVTYCLPFFFVYMTLKNNGDAMWLMNTLSALFFTLIIFDFFTALIVLGLGCFLAWASFIALGNQFTLVLGTVTPFGVSVTFLAVMVIGSIFTRIRGLAEDEKYKALIASEAVQRSKLMDQEAFTKVAKQVAHDIRSPLASLMMIIQACKDIPETMRVPMRAACTRIDDIANNFLKYRVENAPAQSDDASSKEKQPVLISAELLQIMTEKKFQYQGSPVTFESNFNKDAQFSFVDIEPDLLHRAVSNIINNAVDAIDGKEGAVVVSLETFEGNIRISIKDNGKGMPKEVIENIRKQISVTAGKKDGHGIGLAQVNETINKNGGKLEIDSEPGQGTTVAIVFPMCPTPAWCADKIQINSNSVIAILDDDPSIHGAWDLHLEPILEQFPDITIHHFKLGKEAVDFIRALPKNTQDNLLLLTDFELLNQPVNGLDVVRNTRVKNNIIVTSHYAKRSLQSSSNKFGSKILPKQLASEISIQVGAVTTQIQNRTMVA